MSDLFQEAVRLNANKIWQNQECRRSYQNWSDAISQLVAELGEQPAETMVRERAGQLWLERKDRLAQSDWLKAEEQVKRILSRS